MVKPATISVFSASELTDAQKERVEKVFSAKHVGEDVVFEYTVNARLIGGLLVVDGDKFYDGTLRTQIDRINPDHAISEEFATAAYMAKSRAKKRTQPRKTKAQPIENVDATADDIKKHVDSELGNAVSDYKKSFDMRHSGIVVFCGDGVIKVDGLSDAQYGEMLRVENGTQAIALSLENDGVGAIVLDTDDKVSANMIVRSTGMIVSVPVGNQLLGRVVDPLGRPIDGHGKFRIEKYRPIEAPAPPIHDRDKVDSPLFTGILAIDSMIPIGKGQRELIIGDRQTGKTSIAVDTIINQKDKDVICVYVAIGQKSSSVSAIVDTLTAHGAMSNTVIVSATAADSAPLQYIAPYAGCAIAEEFMYSGKDVLIIYDDLSKHAVAYRAMSLLLKRPPGREAYPGDIFYLHSRLLERAAKLSKARGGGSMTAIPIVETLAGDISAYIPTNIISITDGQIYLERSLFNKGVRPAINVGLSVSRVGSGAQSKGMRKVSGKLRLDLSQSRELEAFSQFGAELDEATTSMLEQGRRTNEVLKQDVHSPMTETHQIVLLYVTTKELLKDISVADVYDFKNKFIAYFDINYAHMIKLLQKTGELSMEMALEVEKAVREYAAYYNRSAHE